jgi:hypothetical protein
MPAIDILACAGHSQRDTYTDAPACAAPAARKTTAAITARNFCAVLLIDIARKIPGKVTTIKDCAQKLSFIEVGKFPYCRATLTKIKAIRGESGIVSTNWIVWS